MPTTGEPSAAEALAVAPFSSGRDPASAPETAGTPAPAVREHAPQPHDFNEPSLLTTGEMRRLQLRHDEFVRALATRLSIYLRLEFEANLTSLQRMTYRKFIDGLPSPTHLSLFKIETLNGIGLVDIPPQLGITMVDRLLGGPGQSVILDRDLTEIEIALLDEVVQLLLKEWCSHLPNRSEAAPDLIGHETHGRFLQIASNDTNMIVLSLEAKLNDCAGPIHVAFPFAMIEPVVRQLAPVLESRATTAPAAPKAEPRWNPQLDEIKVALSAHWQGLEITAGQLASLNVGDMLPVAPEHLTRVSVQVAKVSKFIGRLGQQGPYRAVQITQIPQS